MSYILNLSLPLWWFFLPLVIAFIPTAKWSKWKAKYYTAQYKAESNALQLIRDYKRHKAESDAYQSELNKLKHDATEREALIVELNKQIEYLATTADLNKMAAQHRLEWAESLQSKLELSELAHNETKADLEQIQSDLVASIAIMNRTIRGRKQWGKYEAAKQSFESNKTSCEIETVAHDSIGVPRIVKADQSENDNGRHDVLSICDEVNRGVKEQAEAIKKELQGSMVDMSQLEVGDSVVLRNGEVKVIADILVDNSQDTTIPYRLICGSDYFWFRKNGHYATIDDAAISKKDIVQIIKPAKCYKSNKPCQFNCDGLCKNS